MRELAPHTHIIIPDTQSKSGVPDDHLGWVGRYIAEQFAGQPNVTIVHLGDHWDMPSLSSYDRGKKTMEGRRYIADIKAGNRAFARLDKPIAAKAPDWQPRKVLLRGNHEDRITRATEADAQLDGLLSLDDLDSRGWEVYDYLVPVEIDGVTYAHFFANPMTGRPFGGQSIDTRIKTIGYSFTMGHQQTYMHGIRFLTNGRAVQGLVAGACYLHDEDYLGPQGNGQWRGIVVCHQVERGSYDIMQVSLDYLCRRFEGLRLDEWKLANPW